MISNRDRLKEAILIHICKDRTLSYRNRKQPIFNKAAIPVFSVSSVDDARDLFLLVGTKQWSEHPLIPGDHWYKLFNGVSDDSQVLELHDLDEVSDYLQQKYLEMKAAEKTNHG